MAAGTRIKGMGMTDSQDNAAREREEIVARVASFKATQEKFERAREEYFVATLENARHSFDRPPFDRPSFWT
jgi:chorismate mutase